MQATVTMSLHLRVLILLGYDARAMATSGNIWEIKGKCFVAIVVKWCPDPAG